MSYYDMPKYELLCDGVKVAHFDKIGDKWKFNTDINIWRDSFMLHDKRGDILFFHNEELRDEYIRQNNLKIKSVNTKTIREKD